WKPLKLAIVIGNPPDQEAVAGGSLFQLLGISLREPPETARREIGLETGVGVLVQQVSPGSRAAETGLRKGDIILEANRRRVGNPEALQKILAQNRNRRIPLLIKRNKKVLFLVLALPK
ncbi:MAG: PDZ domain-containing protein, partial [SAR324 cluster bacterium]|nr:PDZ domain-containing protein [SAR324 cluster bacterium]